MNMQRRSFVPTLHNYNIHTIKTAKIISNAYIFVSM